MPVDSRPDQFQEVSGRTRQRNHSRRSDRGGKRKPESQAGPTDSMNGGATSKTGIAWSVSTGPPGVPTRAIHQRTKVLFPQHGRSGSSTSYLRFPKHSLLACTKGWRMRVEWRPRSTRRLATRRSSPQALVTVDRCGQQARRAAGCASECRDSRVYMSWCLRPVMTWHVPAIEGQISGSSFPRCRRGVDFSRSPKQAWHNYASLQTVQTTAYPHELTNEIRARSAYIRQAPWAPQ
jgi:hypothetical protein